MKGSTLSKKKFAERANVLGMTFLMLRESNPRLEVAMSCCDFDACGTVACHAGWFAVARGKSRRFGHYGFGESADYMARFLGFKGEVEIEKWARANPDLWGNPHGAQMFCAESAFAPDNGATFLDRALTLRDIGIHWLKVAERIAV